MRIFSGFMLMVLFFGISNAAISVDIDVDESFSQGQQIKFDYVISSDTEVDVRYVLDVDCDVSPKEPLLPKIGTVSLSNPITGSYDYRVVDENVEIQTCDAIVQILSPYEERFNEEFDILGVSKIDLSGVICADSNCLKELKVFGLGETVYMDYRSTVTDVSVSAVIVAPDGTRTTLVLPGSYSPPVIGSYKVEMDAVKTNFRDGKTSVDFGVVESHATVQKSDVPSFDSGREFNDRTSPDDSSGSSLMWVISLVVIFVLIVLAMFIIFNLFRRKNNMEYQER